MRQYPTQPGSRYPAGATVNESGTNFSIFSRHATSVELQLYERADSPTPFQIIRLNPELNRTYFFWHVHVEGLPAGMHYTWRVDGPNDTRLSGRRFDPNVDLLDPWARAITHDLWDRRRSIQHGDAHPKSMRAAVVENHYDWEQDQPLERTLENTIIYELHVSGFTAHPSSHVKYPGTFSGVIEKISYLKDLGITDVELMPVMAFDEQDVPDRAFEEGLKNYWGYSTHSYFSPHPGYCVSPRSAAHAQEFRDMVKALHKAGIGVILDVALNHTAEGGADGPTINFKGFSNDSFYHLDPNDRRIYRDFTGCGNTVNCNHPLVAIFILQCLEYWVREMHVDGFRFDLASVLTRGEDGNPINHAPVVWSIEFSEILAGAKIIAEAWDAAGLYQVGAFPGFRWAEWNGKYRDVIRRFVRGDKGLIGEAATRIAGSSDLYQSSGRLPISSINYVTCHDGFTLNDLVSYDEKHNEVNGEDNQDGISDNLSWNCGHEGDTDDPAILSLRLRQAKNFAAIPMLSQGVPMLQAGDEALRSQSGNNNAYCQDNSLSWFDWTLIEKNKDMLRFVKQMIAFRKRHPCLRRTRFLTGNQSEDSRMPDVIWHGLKLNEPDWSDPDARVLAFTLAAAEDREEDLHVILNMSDEPLFMPLYPIEGETWHRAVDTSQDSPKDILEPAQQKPVEQLGYRVNARSVVVMESRSNEALGM
jgi:isoamylase